MDWSGEGMGVRACGHGMAPLRHIFSRVYARYAREKRRVRTECLASWLTVRNVGHCTFTEIQAGESVARKASVPGEPLP